MLVPAGNTERIFWAILIVLVVGYMLGTWLNRRRGERIGRWLQAGLPKFGGRAAWKILRSVSSAAQVTVVDATPPFRQVQLMYALLTRELPPLWAVERLRHRSDTLAVRADLRTEPACEIEVVPSGSHLRRQLDRLAGERPWNWQPGPAALAIATRGPVTPATMAGVVRFVDVYGTRLQRLSLRPAPGSAQLTKASDGQVSLALPTGPRDLTRSRTRPHLLLFLDLDQAESVPAARLVDDLRKLGRSGEIDQKV